ncbi:ABC transporter permease [Nocardioides marmorisolisilvae]|uniref:ABC transporter permease n=1 Tax=Nocardioides marmorisolisilvae TaxID=1542737 RepID=A0A3N0DS43_9ACTN|nr:ABC transporter permease [Nocardioides marmorisolisilvae]RNL78455.1 ABC transporter permease [Nocardioides marmorisolisilvae]
MTISRTTKIVLGVLTALVLALVYLPLGMVILNSFNTSSSFSWPPSGLTTNWWHAAWHNPDVRDSLRLSLEVAAMSTVIALVLGTMAALALARYRFFGQDAVSLLIILPIALPGIVTGLAFQNLFRSILNIDLGYWTIVVAHATFCIVTVFNNVLARLRRVGGNLEEASMDLGAGTFTTFRLVTFPALRSALLAGGLLAFALSFDEIIVTTFTAGGGTRTLPLWIYDHMFRPNDAPVVNVVAAALLVLSIVPIWLAQRLSQGEEMVGAR